MQFNLVDNHIETYTVENGSVVSIINSGELSGTFEQK